MIIQHLLTSNLTLLPTNLQNELTRHNVPQEQIFRPLIVSNTVHSLDHLRLHGPNLPLSLDHRHRRRLPDQSRRAPIRLRQPSRLLPQQTIPKNVTRTPFPLTGGSLIFSFTNDTTSPTPDPTDEKFKIDMYLTADDADYSPTSFFKWSGIKRMQYWQGFATGWTCSVGFDMISRLRQPGNASAVALLEGLNVTMALLITVGRGPYRGDPNWAGNTWEVDQCAYVTLTSKATTSTKREVKPREGNQDMCNTVNLDYFGAPTPTSSALPSTTSSAATEKMIPAVSLMGSAFVLAGLGCGF